MRDPMGVDVDHSGLFVVRAVASNCHGDYFFLELRRKATSAPPDGMRHGRRAINTNDAIAERTT